VSEANKQSPRSAICFLEIAERFLKFLTSWLQMVPKLLGEENEIQPPSGKKDGSYARFRRWEHFMINLVK
jgi:hypothetical protein